MKFLQTKECLMLVRNKDRTYGKMHSILFSGVLILADFGLIQAEAQSPTKSGDLLPEISGVYMPLAPSEDITKSLNNDMPRRPYLNNQDLIQMDRDRVAQQAERTEQLIQYLATTGDVGGYQQGLTLLQAQNQIAQMQIEQRYLDGMVAIASIENGNFGPIQMLLQQRPEFQGRQVEVRPYTDGTVDIFVDGELDISMSSDELIENLRLVYDRDYSLQISR
jgi:hypothetical protein